MNVLVRQWLRSLSIAYLNVTAQVTVDGTSVYCSDPRSNKCSKADQKKGPANLALTDFDHSVKLGIPAGTRGKVDLSLTFNTR